MSQPSSPARLATLGTVLSLLFSLLPALVWATPAAAASTTLVLNEIDYDQPSTDTAEYVEIKNVSGDAISLDGYAVQMINGASGAAQYRLFALPNVDLPTGDYFVVCGNAASTPNCEMDVSPDSDLIQNGAPDAVALLLNGVVVDTVSYEGATPGFTEGTSGATTDTANPAESLSRCPDGFDGDANDTDFALRPTTPGASNDCPEPPPPFGVCGDPADLIHDIQGNGAASTVEDSIVIVEAVVVGDFQNNGESDDGELNGFHLQEQDAETDADPATSEGIFVFAPGAADVAVGDLVRVQGTVTEFTGSGSSMTELTGIIDLENCGATD
ncbi:MAG TPA: lamin tail domain-containing protein, partial [Acidimicrobiia bacterium]